jgi:hypothetical protein
MKELQLSSDWNGAICVWRSLLTDLVMYKIYVCILFWFLEIGYLIPQVSEELSIVRDILLH